MDWYHTFEFPDGVVTPGIFDHRRVVDALPIPASLAGKRCLDAASADGFFAFEMARRGGDVVSFDLLDLTKLDWQRPPVGAAAPDSDRSNRCFAYAKERLGLDVKRVNGSLYDLTPDLMGTFDFIFLGNVLIHLSDPARALRALRSVARPGAALVSYEPTSVWLSLVHPFRPAAQLHHTDYARWWTTNRRGHERLVHAGMWDVTGRGGPVGQSFGAYHPRWPAAVPRSPSKLYWWAITRQFGVPSSWVAALAD